MTTDTPTKPKPLGKKPERMSPAEQHRAFVEAAREAGADGDESVADLLMGRLGRTKPDPKPTKR